jgi:hypothetical protein
MFCYLCLDHGPLAVGGWQLAGRFGVQDSFGSALGLMGPIGFMGCLGTVFPRAVGQLPTANGKPPTANPQTHISRFTSPREQEISCP